MAITEKYLINFSIEKHQLNEHKYMSSLLSRYSELVFINAGTSQKNLASLLYDYYNAAKQHQETDILCFLQSSNSSFCEISNNFESFLDSLEEIIEDYEAGETILTEELFDFISMHNMGHIMQHSEDFTL